MYMPSTMWTTLLDFRRDPERVKDLLVRRYRVPVYEFSRRQGLSHEDAEDATQEVFLQVCREKFLRKAETIRGKFRTVLLAVTKHVIGSFRRHERAGKRDRRREVPLGDFDVPAEAAPDPEFDRLWVKSLVARALEGLKDVPTIAALRLQLEGKSYHEIAATLGKKETEVTNYIHRAKERLRREIDRLVAEYASQEEMASEIDSLRRFL